MNPALSRLSLNVATTQHWTLKEAVEGCARAGVPYLGLWREKVAEHGLKASATLVREAGLKVSSLCRGGFFPTPTEAERRRRLDDNRQAVEEAAVLGTDVLVLVCGGISGSTIDEARHMVTDGIAALVPFAAEHGVRLGIEPLHPMFAADRSVIVSLEQANDLAELLGTERVGVVIDAYHLWWDPAVYREIGRAAAYTIGFHVSDWLAPPPDVLLGRGMMGDGVIELRRLRSAVDEAGYDGPVEVEIFNRALWEMPGDEVLALIKERFLAHVV